MRGILEAIPFSPTGTGPSEKRSRYHPPMTWSASDTFGTRVRSLPTLGVGISTEFGAWRTGLDLIELRTEHPDLVHFLELGIDLERGIDRDGRAWIERGWPTTYHFLDVNLEEPEDLDEAWVRDTAALAREGIALQTNETTGTVHGYDGNQRSDLAQQALQQRAEFLKQAFTR